EAAMALPPEALGAHDGGGVSGGTGEELVEGGRELGIRHVVGVRTEPRMAEGHVRRVGPRLAQPAEAGLPAIVDARRWNPVLHGLAAEVRMALAAGRGADIDELCDGGAVEEGREIGGGKCPVADGEQAGGDGSDPARRAGAVTKCRQDPCDLI